VCISLVLITYVYHNYYYKYSALGPVRAETRAQSGDWYGSGTLHHGQILRGSLPLLSPAFRRSHFRHQVPPRPPRRERSQRRKVEMWARILSGNFAEMTTSTPFRYLLHAAHLRHGTDGFTSPQKEGVLRIFSSLKIRRLRPGLNPRTLNTKGQQATPRPPKPLYHNVRLKTRKVYFYYVFCTIRRINRKYPFQHVALPVWLFSEDATCFFCEFYALF
jgi:hypothetical protein